MGNSRLQRYTSAPVMNTADILSRGRIRHNSCSSGAYLCACRASVTPGTGMQILPCQHYLHENCAQAMLTPEHVCPTCAEPISSILPSKAIDPVLRRTFSLSMEEQQQYPDPSSCGCIIGCQTARCKCLKSFSACGSDCKCSNCENPFRQLEPFGIDMNLIRGDQCLMQQLLSTTPNQIQTLLDCVSTSPCCQQEVQARDCMAGYTCPICSRKYSYSWCLTQLFDTKASPMRHCLICRKCVRQASSHCPKCRSCFVPASPNADCPCEGNQTAIDATADDSVNSCPVQ